MSIHYSILTWPNAQPTTKSSNDSLTMWTGKMSLLQCPPFDQHFSFCHMAEASQSLHSVYTLSKVLTSPQWYSTTNVLLQRHHSFGCNFLTLTKCPYPATNCSLCWNVTQMKHLPFVTVSLYFAETPYFGILPPFWHVFTLLQCQLFCTHLTEIPKLHCNIFIVPKCPYLAEASSRHHSVLTLVNSPHYASTYEQPRALKPIWHGG